MPSAEDIIKRTIRGEAAYLARLDEYSHKIYTGVKYGREIPEDPLIVGAAGKLVERFNFLLNYIDYKAKSPACYPKYGPVKGEKFAKWMKRMSGVLLLLEPYLASLPVKVFTGSRELFELEERAKAKDKEELSILPPRKGRPSRKLLEEARRARAIFKAQPLERKRIAEEKAAKERGEKVKKKPQKLTPEQERAKTIRRALGVIVQGLNLSFARIEKYLEQAETLTGEDKHKKIFLAGLEVLSLKENALKIERAQLELPRLRLPGAEIKGRPLVEVLAAIDEKARKYSVEYFFNLLSLNPKEKKGCTAVY